MRGFGASRGLANGAAAVLPSRKTLVVGAALVLAGAVIGLFFAVRDAAGIRHGGGLGVLAFWRAASVLAVIALVVLGPTRRLTRRLKRI